jgi:phage baseplate assembly protein W
MTSFAYPFRIDATGHVATTAQDQHVRQLIEQVLFTIPGERVNRPTFGSAVHNLVFAPNSPEESATIQFLIQSALQQWLGSLIHVEAVVVQSEDVILQVTVQYVVRTSQQRQVTTFQLGAAP